MTDCWKFIQEDRAEHYRMLIAIAPVARSPMDKQGANGLQQYIKQLERTLTDALPWKKKRAPTSKLSGLRDKVKSGEAVVILGPGDDPNDPLFAETGVRIVRE